MGPHGHLGRRGAVCPDGVDRVRLERDEPPAGRPPLALRRARSGAVRRVQPRIVRRAPPFARRFASTQAEGAGLGRLFEARKRLVRMSVLRLATCERNSARSTNRPRRAIRRVSPRDRTEPVKPVKPGEALRRGGTYSTGVARSDGGARSNSVHAPAGESVAKRRTRAGHRGLDRRRRRKSWKRLMAKRGTR